MNDSSKHSFVDRPGLLTPTDRQFLLGRKSYASEQSARDRRQAIRDRVRNAILDFSLLFRTLDPADREEIFDDVLEAVPPGVDSPGEFIRGPRSTPPRAAPTGPDLYHALIETLAFLYLGCADIDIEFEPLVEKAIRTAETVRVQGPFEPGHIAVDIDVDYMAEVEPEAVVEKIEHGYIPDPEEYLVLANLFFVDNPRFVSLLTEADVDLDEKIDNRESLSLGESLVYLARIRLYGLDVSPDRAFKVLDERVIQDFGLGSVA